MQAFLVLSHFPDTWFLPFYQSTFGLGILGTSWDSLEARGMWKQEAWVPWKRVLLLLDSGDFPLFQGQRLWRAVLSRLE